MASQSTVTRERVEDIASTWPEKPTELADQMMNQYGTPDEVTDRRFIWHEAGDWSRIHLYRDGTPHKFPKPHEDHLRQFIDYPIDPQDADDLIAFDGSNKLYRTRGELGADCHKESMNYLTINLAHDVVTDEKTVDEARQAFAEIAIKAEMGMEPDYTQGFQFDRPRGDQGDPDTVTIDDALKQKVKETITGAEAEEE